MDCTFIIPDGEHRRYYHLLKNSDHQRIVHEGVLVMNIWKTHDHAYHIEAFFYGSKRIYSWHTVSTKKELHNLIQNLLQEELYGAIQ